jgi:cytochrome P450
MPRDVPAGGFGVCGLHIPGGTTISTQSYSLHRKADVWKSVDSFDPSRWESPTKEMKDAFMPWGGGSRGEYTKCYNSSNQADTTSSLPRNAFRAG